MSTANPEKPNLEAALSSTPVAAKKSRFRPSFRAPRIPRETKLGLTIIFSLVCVFGYVLYSRLTRPTDMDPEKYIAQGNSVLAPSVTSDQPTTLIAQPAGHSPTMLAGTAPQNAMPQNTMTLTNPNNIHASPSQFSAPVGGAGQAAWSPNSSNTSTASPSSDPFVNRGSSESDPAASPATSFSANGFGANSGASNAPASASTQPGQPAATGYGMNGAGAAQEEPRNSFSPPADRAGAGTPAISASLTQPEHAATTASNLSQPSSNATDGPLNTAATPAAGTAVDAFSKSATDSYNTLRQEGQNLASAGSTAQQNLGKAADSASNMFNQAQQQVGQYTNSAGSNANAMLNQAGQAATQYGNDLKNEVQTQAGQYTNQLRAATEEQVQQAQNQLRSTADGLVNDTTNQLRSTTESVLSKAGESSQNLFNSATTAINGGQPLTPLPTTGATQPATGIGMPSAQAPRTLDPSQTASQPLNNAAFSAAQQPEQSIRIPSEPSSLPTQPNYGAAASVPTPPNYGTATPSYKNPTPSYGGATPTPATGGTPLQFNQPTVPATQPATPVYNGATRTNFEQPALSSASSGVRQYTVTAQDSYYSVAEKMYGNGSFNKALYEYNRRNNPAADQLKVGGAMLIPELGTLQSQFPELVPNIAAAAAINPTPLQFPR